MVLAKWFTIRLFESRNRRYSDQNDQLQNRKSGQQKKIFNFVSGHFDLSSVGPYLKVFLALKHPAYKRNSEIQESRRRFLKIHSLCRFSAHLAKYHHKQHCRCRNWSSLARTGKYSSRQAITLSPLDRHGILRIAA